MVSSEFEEQLRGGRLTTARVLYYLPDHPRLIQAFTWQTVDVAPEFPRVHRFLIYWKREIEAVIHSVTVSAAGLVRPANIDITKVLTTLH